MDWKLKFISQENFVKHVEATITSMGKNWNLLILSGLTRILLIRLS